jgi:hypothetical protein
MCYIFNYYCVYCVSLLECELYDNKVFFYFTHFHVPPAQNGTWYTVDLDRTFVEGRNKEEVITHLANTEKEP